MVFKAFFKVFQHNVGNLFDVGLFKRSEHHDFVDTVYEFGLHHLFQGVDLSVAHVVVVVFAAETEFLRSVEFACADVACHYYYRVFETYRSSVTVGESAVFENLQKHIENVGVRLFDFVKEYDRIGFAPYFFGELSAFVKSDEPGRAADEFRHVRLVHIFAHIHADHKVFVAEHRFRKRL